MSTEDDSFMGAWWMGFMLECALAIILVPILMTLPNNKATIKKGVSTSSGQKPRLSETSDGSQKAVTDGAINFAG